jgi:hypothetical protein
MRSLTTVGITAAGRSWCRLWIFLLILLAAAALTLRSHRDLFIAPSRHQRGLIHVSHGLEEHLFKGCVASIGSFLCSSHVVFAVDGEEIPIKLRTGIGNGFEFAFGNL